MSAPAISSNRFVELLSPYYPQVTQGLVQNLSLYLDILLRWNARINLTAVRDPQEIVRRHFGESLFVASHLPGCATLLDLGSGAGFPGLPIQLALPHVAVTLAEAQHRKASFLQEVVRSLALSTEVWAGRAETMPANRTFDVVTMRAVDRPEKALLAARQRVKAEGTLALLTTASTATQASGTVYPLPGSEQSILHLVGEE